MATTTNLGLPEIAAGQANKETTHNQALWMLDALVQARALDYTSSKPGSPSTGHVYLIDTGATGSWSTHLQDVAHYYSGTWHYYSPATGWLFYVADIDHYLKYNGSAWVTSGIGSPSASISPSSSISPSLSPSLSPSKSPSKSPSISPSKSPSLSPSLSPSISPSESPSPSGA